MHRAHALYGSAAAPSDDNALVREHASMIDRCARRIATKACAPHLADDLWSAGALGLIDAASRFEGGRGVLFTTFAEHRVRGAMLDELRRMDHLPRRMREKSDAVASCRRKIAQETGRPAEDSAVAAALHLDLAELAEIEATAQPPAVIDLDATLIAESPGPEEQTSRRQQAAQLATQIKRLPERLQTVLGLHYVEGCTYREIAQMLQVSEPRVCQLHAEAVSKLRAMLSGEDEEEDDAA
jgi:RNA polymerase sigma factor for flagellar operon FliA